MSILTASRRPVEIPRDSDGYLIPSLLPVAAYLCVEEYSDGARSRILERLADGVSPRDCARDGLLEWRDLAEVERLAAGRRPYEAPLPPVAGGGPARGWDEASALEPIPPFDDDAAPAPIDRDGVEPFDAGDFPRAMDAAEYRAALRELVAPYMDRCPF